MPLFPKFPFWKKWKKKLSRNRLACGFTWWKTTFKTEEEEEEKNKTFYSAFPCELTPSASSPLKRSEWHVLMMDHTVLSTTHAFVHEQNDWAILPLFPSLSASLHFGRYSFPVLQRLGGCVVLERRRMFNNGVDDDSDDDIAMMVVMMMMMLTITRVQRILMRGRNACCAIIENWMIPLLRTPQQRLLMLFRVPDNHQ